MPIASLTRPGGASRANVVDIDPDEWDRIVNMNLKSVFLCSQAVLPTMLKAKYGKIVSISSIYGFAGNATRASYAAAKAGVAVFTKSLALEHVKAPVDYINPHATSTPVGDIPEINAIKTVFGATTPAISATKSLTGHSQGAAGVHEAIYTL